MGARRILEKGYIWSIGTRENIRVWGDQWLPREGRLKVESPMPIGYEEVRVRDLYRWEGNRRQWDIDILHQLFVREEVDEVLRIPLPDNMEKDDIIWWRSRDEMYTVKGGYWLALEDQVEQAKATEQGNFIWDHIWGANVPRIVKDFLWRGCRNVILCRTRLFERDVDVSNVCDFCGTATETLTHIIWNRPLAQSLWTHVSCPLPFIADYFVSFKDWVDSVVDTLPQMEMTQVFMYAGKLWTHRNERVWQGEEKGPLLLIAEANSYIQDF